MKLQHHITCFFASKLYSCRVVSSECFVKSPDQHGCKVKDTCNWQFLIITGESRSLDTYHLILQRVHDSQHLMGCQIHKHNRQKTLSVEPDDRQREKETLSVDQSKREKMRLYSLCHYPPYARLLSDSSTSCVQTTRTKVGLATNQESIWPRLQW